MEGFLRAGFCLGMVSMKIINDAPGPYEKYSNLSDHYETQP